MTKSKHTFFFINIFRDSFSLLFKHKLAWIAGFIALFFTGAFSYQLLYEGIKAFAQPGAWIESWLSWTANTSPMEFFAGQWNILTSDPRAWFAVVFAWTLILGILLLIFALSVYCAAVLISLAKIKEIEGQSSLVLAMRLAAAKFKPLFWTVVLIQAVSNVLIMVFSLPVLALGGEGAAGLNFVFVVLILILFVVVSFILSMLSIYSILYIVIEGYRLQEAVIKAWALLKEYWFVSLEMFFSLLVVGIVAALILFSAVALLVIPITILGTILISNQSFDFISVVPKLTLYLLSLVFIIMAAAFTSFQVYCWSFLFMSLEKIAPQSRFAQFIEMHILG